MADYQATVYGAYQLNKVQFGRESVSGTGVPATHVHRGPFIDIEDTGVSQFTEEQAGILAQTGQQYRSRAGATLSLPSHPFSFEHGPVVFEAGICKGDLQTTASPYLRGYPFVYEAADVADKEIATYTWETFNALSGDARELNYGFVESFELTGEVGQPWMLAAVWQGRDVIVAAPTDPVALEDVELAMFQNTEFYIDEPDGAVGDTKIMGVMMGASVSVETGIRALYTPMGQLYFSNIKFVLPVITGSFTYELEGDGSGIVVAERAAWTAKTPRLVRLKVVGTNGRLWQFDAAINYTSFGTYTDSDGDTVVTVDWEARYNPTAALFAEFAAQNLVATYT